MAHYVDSTPHTPAEELRSALDEIEHLLASIGTPESDARALLHTLDKAQEMAESLQAEGVEVRPELVRMQSLHGLVRRKGAALLRDLKPAGGLALLRSQVKPEESHWWWFLDREIAAKRRKLLMKAILIPAIAVLVLAIGIRLFEYAFPPDKNAVKVTQLEDDAAAAIQKGDLRTALRKYEDAAEVAPDDGTIQVWIGALAMELGDAQKSKEAFARAQKLLKPSEFHLSKGYVYFYLGKPEAADQELQRAIELDPNNGMAYYLRGNVLAAQRRFGEAKQMYILAAQAADRAGDHRLEAMARIQMANVVQQESGLGAPSLPR